MMPHLPKVLAVPCDANGIKADELSRMLDQYSGNKIKVS